MTVKKIVEVLIKLADEDKNVKQEDVLRYVDLDSDEYLEVEKLLDAKDILIIDESEHHDLSDDEDVLELEMPDLDAEPDAEALLQVDDDEDDDVDIANVIVDVEDIKVDDLVGKESATALQGNDDPVKMFLREMGEIPLLSLEDETKFAMRIKDGKIAREQLDLYEAGELKLKDSEVEDLNDTLFRASKAKERLVESNLRLVVANAKKYTNRGLHFIDLIQEGNIGLMKAADKFDVEKGFKFSTYATWWIRQGIARAVADQGRVIRIPVHMVETINRMLRIQRELAQELGREATISELAAKLDMTVQKVQEIKRISLDPISLEQPVGEEEDSTLGDFIADPNAKTPHQYMMDVITEQLLSEFLDTLTEREAKVLRLRYGLYDGKTYTLEDVGREFNVTRERIRQIEAKALRKLRSPAKQNKFRELLNG